MSDTYFDKSPVKVEATAVQHSDGGETLTIPRHLGFKEGTVFVPRSEWMASINAGDHWDVVVTKGFAARNNLPHTPYTKE